MFNSAADCKVSLRRASTCDLYSKDLNYSSEPWVNMQVSWVVTKVVFGDCRYWTA